MNLFTSTTIKLCIIAIVGIIAVSCQCKVHKFNGLYYNLSPMSISLPVATLATGFSSYSFVNSTEQVTYYFNICQNSRAPCNPKNGVCLFEQLDNVWVGGGAANTDVYPLRNKQGSSIGIRLRYGEARRQNHISIIEIECDLLATNSTVISASRFPNTTSFEPLQTVIIRMKSPYACALPANTAPPLISSFSSDVFFYSGIAGDDTYNLGKVVAGSGKYYYNMDLQRSFLNATQQLPVANMPLGLLTSYFQNSQISYLNECNRNPVGDLMPNKTHMLVYDGTAEYVYNFFRVGKRVTVNRYVGNFNDESLDDDDNINTRLLTDAETGDYVWADASLFYGEENLRTFNTPLTWMEFDSFDRSFVPLSAFTVPASWNCP